MAKAIDAGLPKLRIEEAAARTQARIDSGRQPVVGVNQFRPDEPEQIDVLKVDTPPPRHQQRPKPRKPRPARAEAPCRAALDRLTEAAAASVTRSRESGL